jgi:putative nucleotidyltransferase with HDIG domain
VALYDEARQMFDFVADIGLPAGYREQTTPASLALYARLLEQWGSLIVIPDVQAVPDLPDPELYAAFNIRTSVTTSMVRGTQLVGVLALITVGQVRHFTNEELEVLKGLANQAAQAITNAHLFAETETRLAHLRALREIDRAITGSLDVRLTLKVFLDQTLKQLRVDAADILLVSSASQTLTYGAGQGFRTREMEQARVRLGESFAGQVALERRRLAIPDIRGTVSLPVFAQFVANEGFVAYYGVPVMAKGQLIGVLEVYQRTPLEPDEEWLNFLETLAGQAAIAIDNARLFTDLQHSNLQLTLAYDDTIEGWSRALDLRDKETEGHSQRVTDFTVRLARAMQFNEADLVHVRRGALLHDIGKMGVPDGILLKPGKLTEEEWVVMKKHPTYAYELLSPISFLRPALDIPYGHHEKWDGTGYPRQIKGEAIPLAARLFAVVDVWDALRSDRPYRAGWSEDKVLAHLQALAGTHFEPRAVTVFLGLLEADRANV